MKKRKSVPSSPSGQPSASGIVSEIKAFMTEHRLDEVLIQRGKDVVDVRLGGRPSDSVVFHSQPAARAPAPVTPAPVPETSYVKIRSPMAGTFYRSTSPSTPPYVNEGDTVTPAMTVCIIEAMKVMNEIKADCSGKIVRISAENVQQVESGTVLFEVDPAG